MSPILHLVKKATNDELEDVENLLEDVFEPVLPRQAYVKDLNRRLTRLPDSHDPVVSPNLPSVSGKPLTSMIWSFFGLFSGLVMVILGIRVIIILITSLRAIYQKQA